MRTLQGLFSFYSAVNLLLLAHIHTTGNLRSSCRENYVRPFGWIDILLLLTVFSILYVLFSWMTEKLFPHMRKRLDKIDLDFINRFLKQHFFIKIFGIIFLWWFFLFLLFYPGTAMNDTIFILQSPMELSNQHPILYILYTYGFYRLGVWLGNPSIGMAFLSIFQMVCMDYVLTYAISLLHKYSGKSTICMLFALYFAIAPIFGTYAVSAIKDTPFSIAAFMLMALLYEGAITGGKVFGTRSFCIHMWISLFVMAGFRSNGMLIVVGTGLCAIIIYWRQKGRLINIWGTVLIVSVSLNICLMPRDVDKLFQEKVGIPIQQVGAAVNKGKPLTQTQEEYLYHLLPKEKWEIYAPGCSDNIKWNDEFDREYLNHTRGEFLRIWLELMPHNLGVYAEAYIMNTYGIWGIETRSSEQYYVKGIHPNELGLYQESPLPDAFRAVIYPVYCNRYTYGYLSAGTAFWIMFAVIIWFVYHGEYAKACAFAPMMCCFISLMLATPIAFAFRYVYTLAMAFPFYVLIPFLRRKDL